MSARPLHVALSPLSLRIYCGTVLKSGGTWGAGREDVTGPACAAVAQKAIAEGGSFIVNGNGAPMYEITARLIAPAQEPNP